jgi:hypothetical protein
MADEKTVIYKQCHLEQIGLDENCDSPWETISLIDIRDIKPVITLTQYKVTRNFKPKVIYPQHIKKKIINKAKESNKT